MLFFGLFFLFGCQNATTTDLTNSAEYLELTIVDQDSARFDLYDATDTIIHTTTVSYFAEDSLLEILQSQFTVYCQGSNGSPDDTCSFSGQYGHYVMGIGPLTAFESNQFISFEINGSFAMTGIDDTDVIVGAVYKFSIGTF